MYLNVNEIIMRSTISAYMFLKKIKNLKFSKNL